MKCTARHTKYQPMGEEFKCPQCGEMHPYFYIDESENCDCELLHVDDFAVCEKCSYSCDGASLARQLKRIASLITCPTCNGRGLIEGPCVRALEPE